VSDVREEHPKALFVGQDELIEQATIQLTSLMLMLPASVSKVFRWGATMILRS
jgi:hypothetical protein